MKSTLANRQHANDSLCVSNPRPDIERPDSKWVKQTLDDNIPAIFLKSLFWLITVSLIIGGYRPDQPKDYLSFVIPVVFRNIPVVLRRGKSLVGALFRLGPMPSRSGVRFPRGPPLLRMYALVLWMKATKCDAFMYYTVIINDKQLYIILHYTPIYSTFTHIQYQSKVWTHLLIPLNEKVCPNF